MDIRLKKKSPQITETVLFSSLSPIKNITILDIKNV